ncbi:TIGR03617 family F420-dependent LLM class oxidoreductase [Frankia sp. CNm7]|uniref:TIGR03617 family F420-dependent LLM class oxidoreductase n=1 Tax=Frankia nepalensis TaxID=1836974 RepID=A0A937RDF6_9ACTN|nr:TIGR03617 family F420-dependent LLM class oxidoreductase [Frankia nepalensis]MBL7500543.1 TIGR03617 family F420-dependent LLM class oxidoreductase [Frankia nepalensis]MBL7509763.1 TIGR03617 family F420-dependent LLM class oxidoreductase [Frankia nepalensis]MBL7523267.1 TIGR03617 family F420-dependent LLM class oxidoreductase [Frankia nepalensis]MBL7627882.1 TIGR03617 family F420-dependent LLM class oxidoreductase [Frankia nepalensis]
MKIDAIVQCDLTNAVDVARRAEAAGFDGMLHAEVAHDPFLPLTHAAAATKRITLGTGIAVAFARSPMTVAVTAADLHRQSEGRFVLGLGSQIRAHITRRFSMPWSSPAPRMREYVAALRAIWDSWQNDSPLTFEGDFYQHTLMTPMFNHGPSPHGAPKIFLAGVGPVMTTVAGEVADGYLAHGFTTPDYLRDVTLVNLARGLERAGRSRSEIEVSVPIFSALGRNDAEVEANIKSVRHTLAFYASTPAYRPVLEHHGWADLGAELTRLSKQGQWHAMGDLIDDDVLRTFTIVGKTEDFAPEVLRRYGDLVDRIQIGLLSGPDDEEARESVRALQRAATAHEARGRDSLVSATLDSGALDRHSRDRAAGPPA